MTEGETSPIDGMPVLVTGGSGTIGGSVVGRLVAMGRSVRVLSRSEEAAQAARRLGAIPFPGSLADIDGIARAMAGCEVVYHAAGSVQFCLSNPTALFDTNVAGTINCVKAAASARVRRIVYTSSAATLGEEGGQVGAEDTAHRGWFLSDYERSKCEAEERALRLADELGIQMVCLNPASVQGPGRASGTGQVLLAFLRGQIRLWVDTTISIVDVDDCALGHILAEQNGEAGRRYVLCGSSMTTEALANVLTRIAPNIRPPWLVPRAVAGAAGAIAGATGRVLRRTPIACSESVRTLLHGHQYDGSRAERELGLRYTSAEQTLRRTAEWLVSEGLVPASALA